VIEALRPIFAGPLAPYGEGLLPPDDPREALPGSRLLDPAVLQALLERYGAQYAAPDPRSTASVWSKWHFSVLVTPTVVATLLASHRLPVALEEIAVVLAPEGRTAAVKLPHAGARVEAGNPFEAFATLFEQHLEPLVAGLSACSGAAPRVFWSNLGNLFENVVRRMEAALGPAHAGVAAGRSLLESREWPGRAANPLYRPVRYLPQPDGSLKRLRRICCLRYLTPGLDYCSTCPLDRKP